MYFRYAKWQLCILVIFDGRHSSKGQHQKWLSWQNTKKYLWKMRYFHQIDFKFGGFFIGQLFCLDLSSKNSNSGRIKCYIYTFTWTSIAISRFWHTEWIDIETKWVRKCNVHWTKRRWTKKQKNNEEILIFVLVDIWFAIFVLFILVTFDIVMHTRTYELNKNNC